MSTAECAVCAWRGDCKLKFQYQSGELHCRDFSRDIAFPPDTEETKDDRQEASSGKTTAE